jgi:hypothetical protein
VSIAQTSNGSLWLATPTGLFRFDGTRFERFRSLFSEQLLSNNIRSVFAPQSGGLWIGYAFGGLSFLHNDGRLKNYGGEAVSTGSVINFAQDQDGSLWAGATSGIWRFDGSHRQHLGVEWDGRSRLEVLDQPERRSDPCESRVAPLGMITGTQHYLGRTVGCLSHRFHH